MFRNHMGYWNDRDYSRFFNRGDFNGYSRFWMNPYMMIGMVIVGALIILAIYLLLRNRRRHEMDYTPSSHEAMTILRNRLAKGEIDEAEYQSKMALLSHRGEKR